MSDQPHNDPAPEPPAEPEPAAAPEPEPADAAPGSNMYAPNQQAVHADMSGPAEEGEGGTQAENTPGEPDPPDPAAK